jgi:hypothetical protein
MLHSQTFKSERFECLAFLDFSPEGEEPGAVTLTIRYYLGDQRQADIKLTFEERDDPDTLSPTTRATNRLASLTYEQVNDIYNEMVAPYFVEEGGEE